MTTLSQDQIDQARALREQGQSYRKIAAQLGTTDSRIMKALKQPTAEKTLLIDQIRQQRLVRLKHQNSKLAVEVKRLHAATVDAEEMKRHVLACNSIVKLQLLSLPQRVGLELGLTPEQVASLKQSVQECCNELAYERERLPQTCPTCGEARKEHAK